MTTIDNVNVNVSAAELKKAIVQAFPQNLSKAESYDVAVRKMRDNALMTKTYNGMEIEKEGGLGPGPSDVYVDPALQNFNMYFQQDQTMFVADMIPNIPVDKPEGKYWSWDKESTYRDEMREMDRAVETPGGVLSLSDDTYKVKKYGYRTDIDDDTLDAAEPIIEYERVAVETNALKTLIKKETLMANLIFNAANWSGRTSSEKWNAGVGSVDPTIRIWEQKTEIQRKTGYVPNVLFLGQETFNDLMVSDEIRSLLDGAATPQNPAVVSKMALAALFGLDAIHVMGGVTHDDERLADASIDFIVADSALLCYMPASVPRFGVTCISRFGYRRPGFTNDGQRVKRIRMELKDSTRIQTNLHTAYKINATELGYLLTNLHQ